MGYAEYSDHSLTFFLGITDLAVHGLHGLHVSMSNCNFPVLERRPCKMSSQRKQNTFLKHLSWIRLILEN
jgi:hypothetical protein